MSNRLDPELVEMCRPNRHACVEGHKRIEMLEELADAVLDWNALVQPTSPRWTLISRCLGEIQRDNERVAKLNSDYDAAVEKLNARPNGGWLDLSKETTDD